MRATQIGKVAHVNHVSKPRVDKVGFAMGFKQRLFLWVAMGLVSLSGSNAFPEN